MLARLRPWGWLLVLGACVTPPPGPASAKEPQARAEAPDAGPASVREPREPQRNLGACPASLQEARGHPCERRGGLECRYPGDADLTWVCVCGRPRCVGALAPPETWQCRSVSARDPADAGRPLPVVGAPCADGEAYAPDPCTIYRCLMGRWVLTLEPPP